MTATLAPRGPADASASASASGAAAAAPPLLQVVDLVKHYRLPRERLLRPAPVIAALRGLSFDLRSGRSLGIVGESGSGKSTLARQVMALETPTTGQVRLLGRDLQALPPAQLKAARRDFQMVFQDPYGSLDPRQRIGRVVAEPLARLAPGDARQRVADALEAVGLRASDAQKFAHEFSGGQRQRIAIARALITRPKLIVADEPVSALDVSVQAQVLNLFADLQQAFGVTYLFVSHDLAVVDHVCDEVAVMYAGRIVEQGPPDVLFRTPAHPYTRALIAAMPGRPGTRMAMRPGREMPVRSGTGMRLSASTETPGLPNQPATSPLDALPPTPRDDACAYAPRCGFRQARCLTESPLLRTLGGGADAGGARIAAHRAACHFADSVLAEPPLLSGENR